MMSPSLLGSFSNIMGLDGLVIFLIQIAFVVGLVLLVRFFVRKSASERSGGTTESRLAQLEAMRSGRTITEAEYQEQRRRILSQI